MSGERWVANHTNRPESNSKYDNEHAQDQTENPSLIA
jgi:hypothetical protein